MTETILAYGFVMAAMFYLSRVVKDNDRLMKGIYLASGVFFGWLMLTMSGAPEGFIIAGYILTGVPFGLYLFLLAKNKTFDEFLKAFKPVDERSAWGSLDEEF